MRTIILISVMMLVSGCNTVREIGNYCNDVFAVSGPALGKVVHAACDDAANLFDKGQNDVREKYSTEQPSKEPSSVADNSWHEPTRFGNESWN